MIALAGRSILVVEDDYYRAHLVKRTLEAAGATVLGPVPSAIAALHLLHDGRPDAAVLDVDLRDGLVFPVADALASVGVPFLFTTGSDPRMRPVRHAAAPWLVKPVEEAATTRALEELLRVAPP